MNHGVALALAALSIGAFVVMYIQRTELSAALQRAQRALIQWQPTSTDWADQQEAYLRLVHGFDTATASSAAGASLVEGSPHGERLDQAQQTEAIIAWRAWKIGSAGTRTLLKSVVVDVLWPSCEPLEAEDLPPVGSVTRGPGIYAAKSKEDAHRAMTSWSCSVYGTVALWGNVVEHQLGYRAQYAYPQHVWCKNERVAQELRRLYGCEAEVDQGWMRKALSRLWPC
jgi:hypothetical protein